ncbi:hypothetical protein QTN25_010656 [Entamoeba marina]
MTQLSPYHILCINTYLNKKTFNTLALVCSKFNNLEEHYNTVIPPFDHPLFKTKYELPKLKWMFCYFDNGKDKKWYPWDKPGYVIVDENNAKQIGPDDGITEAELSSYKRLIDKDHDMLFTNFNFDYAYDNLIIRQHFTGMRDMLLATGKFKPEMLLEIDSMFPKRAIAPQIPPVRGHEHMTCYPRTLTELPEGIINCFYVNNLIIPDTVKIIREGAFTRCFIDDLIIPPTVEYIEEHIFSFHFGGNVHVHKNTKYHKDAFKCVNNSDGEDYEAPVVIYE